MTILIGCLSLVRRLAQPSPVFEWLVREAGMPEVKRITDEIFRALSDVSFFASTCSKAQEHALGEADEETRAPSRWPMTTLPVSRSPFPAIVLTPDNIFAPPPGGAPARVCGAPLFNLARGRASV
jgi:hypothetical protein